MAGCPHVYRRKCAIDYGCDMDTSTPRFEVYGTAAWTLGKAFSYKSIHMSGENDAVNPE